MEEIVYLNGLVKRSEARISPMDYGFLYGYGLFETMRAYKGAVFRLDQHLRRLAASAGRLEIPVDISVLRSAVRDVLSANRLTEARVRLTVSPGEGSLSPEPHTCRAPVIFAAAAQNSVRFIGGVKRYWQNQVQHQAKENGSSSRAAGRFPARAASVHPKTPCCRYSRPLC